MSVEAALSADRLERVRALLGRHKLDGWLLFDYRGLNPVAARVLGARGLAARRLFVLLPAVGRPVAVVHRTELERLAGFPGELRPYTTWRELEQELARLLSGKTVAMEYSARDAVPFLDRVPSGIVELVREAGARVATSADLVTALAATWTPEETAGHRTAAAALKSIALAAFQWVEAEYGEGRAPTERALQAWLLGAMERAGLAAADPPVVASGVHTADPSYEPCARGDAPVWRGEVLLVGLAGGIRADAVGAEQTWAAFVGGTPPAEVARIWSVVRDARDQVVAVLRDRWREGWSVKGADLDDAARKVVRSAGFEAAFGHRTGHSLDRDRFGSGPHLDNYETHDDRALAAGTGYAVHPGIYLPGRFGVRSGIGVVLHEDGPEVTPEGPQQELIRLDVPPA